MQYRYGNLITQPRSKDRVLVITTNGFVKRSGEAVMGRGIAKQLRDSVDGAAYKLGQLLITFGNRPFRLSPDVWTLPVKHHWTEAADGNLIASGLDELSLMIEKWHPAEMMFPRPGCGNGRLDWEQDGIRALMENFSSLVEDTTTIEVWDFRERT